MENTYCKQICSDGKIAVNGTCLDINTDVQGETNFAPIAIISVLVLSGLLSSLLFLILDHKLQPAADNYANRGIDLQDSDILRGPPPPCKVVEATDGSNSMTRTIEAPSVWRLLLETHCVTGLIWYSIGLERWVKTVLLAATLIIEMAFTGARYVWEDKDGNTSSLAEIWTGYDYVDFLYCLSGLAVGLLVVLTALYTLASKAKFTLMKVLFATSVLCTVLVTGAAAGLFTWFEAELRGRRPLDY